MLQSGSVEGESNGAGARNSLFKHAGRRLELFHSSGRQRYLRLFTFTLRNPLVVRDWA